MSYVIWGKDIVPLETYINNESKYTICSLEFSYDNKKYKIIRKLENKNGKAKETLTFHDETLGTDKTGCAKSHTKKEIINIFGERDDAKTTWLCCQNTSTNFLNDKNNIEIFARLIGIDQFKNEFDEQRKEQTELDTRRNDKKKEIKHININYNDNLQEELDNLKLKQISLKESNDELEYNIKQERSKVKFGTPQNYTEWEETLINKKEKIKQLKHNLSDITELEYKSDKDILRARIIRNNEQKDILLSKKTPIDIDESTIMETLQVNNTNIQKLTDTKNKLETKLELL